MSIHYCNKPMSSLLTDRCRQGSHEALNCELEPSTSFFTIEPDLLPVVGLLSGATTRIRGEFLHPVARVETLCRLRPSQSNDDRTYVCGRTLWKQMVARKTVPRHSSFCVFHRGKSHMRSYKTSWLSALVQLTFCLPLLVVR